MISKEAEVSCACIHHCGAFCGADVSCHAFGTLQQRGANPVFRSVNRARRLHTSGNSGIVYWLFPFQHFCRRRSLGPSVLEAWQRCSERSAHTL